MGEKDLSKIVDLPKITNFCSEVPNVPNVPKGKPSSKDMETTEELEDYRIGLDIIIDKIIEENEFTLYFPDDHLAGHRRLLLNAAEFLYRRVLILTRFNRDCIAYVFTVQERRLKSLLSLRTQEILFKRPRDTEGPLLITVDIQKRSTSFRMLLVSLQARINDEPISVEFEIEQEVDLDVIQDFISQYKEIRKETESNLDHFISTTPLKSYFNDDLYFHKRKTAILDWVSHNFIYGLLVKLDYTYPYLYEDVFSYEAEAGNALNPLITGKGVGYSPSTGIFHKRLLLTECIQMSCRASTLLSQLKISEKDREYISNLEEYKDVLRLGRDETIDVCKVRFAHTKALCSITFFPKTAYNDAMRALKTRKQFDEDLLEYEDCEKIKNYAKTRVVEQLCREKIEQILEEATTLVTDVPGGLIIDEGVDVLLIERLMNMSNATHSIESTSKMINGLVNRTLVKANEIIEARGGPTAFRGDLSLSKRVIPLAELNETTLPPHMRDQETNLIIQDHKKLNTRINTLNCTFGSDWLSQCVVPCIANNHLYYAKNMLVNNGTINIYNINEKETLTAPSITNKKKRTRVPSITDSETRKKYRLVTNGETSVTFDEDGTRIVPLTSERVENPDWTTSKVCLACDRTLLLKSFCHLERKKDTNYCYIKSVCNACRVHVKK